MNRITAVGRLAADAELRCPPSGDPILGFRVASDVGFGDKKTTNWFTCSIFGKRAQSLAEHLTKGTKVTVIGTLTLREWTDRDGLKRLSPDIRVDDIDVQIGKQDKEAKPARQQAATGVADLEDDMPF